jgi:hypothetical protein
MFFQKNCKVLTAHLPRLWKLQVFGLMRKTNILDYVLCQLTLVNYFMACMDKFVVMLYYLSEMVFILGILEQKL